MYDKCCLWWFSLAFLVSVSGSPEVWAGEQAVPAGFKALWNGTDLSGWVAHNGKLDVWSVQNGTLVTEGKGKGWLMTQKEYDDFDLFLQYRIGAKANSGVALRSPLQGDPALTGMEVQITDDASYPKLNKLQGTGAIYNMIPLKKLAARPAGAWNQMHIVARGRRITVAINGTEVLNDNLDNHKQLHQRFPGLQRARGRIGLQSQLGRAEFRNIWLKDLTPGPQPQVVLETGGHTAQVVKVFFTADNRELVSVARDLTIRYWDVETGELKRVLRLPVRSQGAVALARNRETLAVATGAGTILFLNVANGGIRILGLPSGTHVNSLALSPDGEQLAVGIQHEAFVIEARTGKRLQSLRHLGGQDQIGFSPDGTRVATLSGAAGMGVMNLTTGQSVTIPVGGPFAWFPNSRTLALARVNDIEYWDASPRKQHKKFAAGTITSLQFLPGGNELLTTGTHPRDARASVTILDVKTGQERQRFQIPAPWRPHPVTADLSPDGTLVAAASGPSNVVCIWRRADGKLLHALAGKGAPFYAAGWRQDGRAIAWGNGLNHKDTSYLGHRPLTTAFDLADLKFLPKPNPKEYRRAVLHLDGLQLIPEQATIQRGQNLPRLDLQVYSIGTSRAGTLLPEKRVLIAGDHAMLLYDVSTGGLFDKGLNRLYFTLPAALQTVTLPDEIWDIAPSPDNRFLLTASRDQVLRVWTLQPKRVDLLLSLFQAGQDWIIWTPQGYYAATPGGERLMGWQVNNGHNKLASFYPAERFRQQLYRPDVIKLVLEKGSVNEAVRVANAERKKQGLPVATARAEVAQLLPPLASLQLVKQDSNQVTVRATATAQVMQQPVASLRLLVDGKVLPNGQGLVELPQSQARAEKEWTLAVPPGKHHFTLLARSTDGAGVSQPLELEFVDPTRKPSLHVLAIGVNDYREESLKLKYARADAEAIKDAFAGLTGSGSLFQPGTLTTLVDAQATSPAVFAKLAELRPRVQQQDLVVVFFAGHGVKNQDDFYLLTVESSGNNLTPATALAGKELRKKLGDFPCQVLLLLDACHSAAALKAFRPATDDVARNLTEDEVGVAVLCAAMGHQFAQERSQQQHGLFTAALLEALQKSEGVPFNPRSRLMFVHHLHSFVHDYVTDLTESKQTPFLSVPWTVESFAIRKVGKK